MMTKKSYAAIKSAQERMSEIEKIAQNGQGAAADVAIKEILAIAEKWNRDFADCDPDWQPPQKEEEKKLSPREQVGRLDAFIQTK